MPISDEAPKLGPCPGLYLRQPTVPVHHRAIDFSPKQFCEGKRRKDFLAYPSQQYMGGIEHTGYRNVYYHMSSGDRLRKHSICISIFHDLDAASRNSLLQMHGLGQTRNVQGLLGHVSRSIITEAVPPNTLPARVRSRRLLGVLECLFPGTLELSIGFVAIRLRNAKRVITTTHSPDVSNSLSVMSS